MKRKKIELKVGQVWKPKKGKYRRIYSYGLCTRKIYFCEGRDILSSTPKEFRVWIFANGAVLKHKAIPK